LRICIIGKYPPIQGGVSMRTYRTAHALAARGHEVHVVTNAREVAPPFRMHMRAEDWARCEAQGPAGSVTVHWTDPVDRSQSHIPMASPFVSKLASIAGRVHAEHPFDVIFSHYLEPYGVAGYLASQMTGAPHVVRTAGSDAGRLWHHPQLEPLYDHVLRCADRIVATGAVAERAAARGADPRRIVPGGSYAIPEDSFSPEGPVLDIAAIRIEAEQDADLRGMLWGGFAGGKPHIGVYGKLGDNKGSFALLDALHRLKRDGLAVGLVALAHGRPDVETRFRRRATELQLDGDVLQIPFLPHWRVPEFLRSCLAVCCLEQDFPIGFHSPIIPLEVLLCGRCLVASTELIRKLPQWHRLPHGYGCAAVNDVHDEVELSGKIAAVVRHPKLAGIVGARGRSFAQACQQDTEFPDKLEQILEAAARRLELPPASPASNPDGPDAAMPDQFPLTTMICTYLDTIGPLLPISGRHEAEGAGGLDRARQVLASLNDAAARGNVELRRFAPAVEVEIRIAAEQADIEARPRQDTPGDPLFRIALADWALDSEKLGELMPVRDARLRILRFEHDISRFWGIETIAEFPESPGSGPSYIVLSDTGAPGEPLLVDRFTVRILELGDGTRTADEIVRQLDRDFGRADGADHLAWIENLLVSGLVGVRGPEHPHGQKSAVAAPGPLGYGKRERP
jgi:glycosyltransferase involved in cell wall biosynthesis